MFTGLVQSLGEVVLSSTLAQGRRVQIATEVPERSLELGDSVCVSGVCLTITAIQLKGRILMEFDVSPETCGVTSLGRLAVKDWVNLEWALRAGDPLGGHVVSGHVDGLSEVCAVEEDGAHGKVMRFKANTALAYALAPKGSVCVDGVSLTVNQVDDYPDRVVFSVYLIPHTLTHTNFGHRKVGDQVNLEVDMMARYLHRMVQQQSQ